MEMRGVEGQVGLDRLVQLVGHGGPHTREGSQGSQSCLLASSHSYTSCSHDWSAIRNNKI